MKRMGGRMESFILPPVCVLPRATQTLMIIRFRASTSNVITPAIAQNDGTSDFFGHLLELPCF
jgi:hypothetical protein